jgi:hypothetical protein
MQLKEIITDLETRYIIIDDTNGNIIDDAQGYGFKSKKAAYKCYYYKFKGGKQKEDETKKLVKQILKTARTLNLIQNLKEILETFEYELFYNVKDYSNDDDLRDQADEEAFEEFKDSVIKLLNMPPDCFKNYKMDKVIDFFTQFIKTP